MQRLLFRRDMRRNFPRIVQNKDFQRCYSGDPGAQEEIPEPPSTFAALAAMGGGAVGAVAIAAVGVYGVFKMAFWVASETGRSIKATNSSMPTEPLQTQPVAEKLEVQNMEVTPQLPSSAQQAPPVPQQRRWWWFS